MNHMIDCSNYSTPWDEYDAMERERERDEYEDELDPDRFKDDDRFLEEATV